MAEDLDDLDSLRGEIDRLREGEEDGYDEHTIPTAGQLLKVLHDLDGTQRIERLNVLLAMAEAGRFCVQGLHEANLGELRQRMMGSWSALHRIGQLCREAEGTGTLSASAVNALLPDGLRRT